MDTTRQVDVNLMSILHRCVEKKTFTNIDVALTNFFDVILIYKNLTSFRRALFELFLMGKKSTPFQCTSFDVISTGENSTSFNVIFQCNFNEWKINTTLTCFF